MTVHEPLSTPRVAKLTVKDFLLLDNAGAFSSYAKTELIDGRIIVVNAQFSEHMVAKVLLLRRLADACDMLGSGLEAWSEGSVALDPISMPEPDLLITRVRPTAGPVALESIALIAEVSDNTARYDLGKKARIYAAAGVAEYWVFDLDARRIVQHWLPASRRFTRKQELALGQPITSATLAGLTIATDGL